MAKQLTKREQNIDDEVTNTIYTRTMTIRQKVSHISNLIDRGANIKKVDPIFGNSFLHQASISNSAEIVKILIEKGADKDLQNKHGETPLYYAFKLSKINVARELLKNNADPNIEKFATPGFEVSKSPLLHLIIDKGEESKELIELLVKNGAKVGEALERLSHNNIYATVDTIDLLKLAVLFEKNGIKNMSEKTQKYIQTYANKTNNRDINVYKESLKQYFQNLLTAKVKSAIEKGYKDTAELLQIVDSNIQQLEASGMPLKEMYQGSILDHYELCKTDNYSSELNYGALSLKAAALIHILKLQSEGTLNKTIIKEKLPSDLFISLETFQNEMSTVGESALEGVD